MPHHDLVCLVCLAERPNTYLPLRQLAVPEDHGGYLVRQTVDFPICCGVPMAYDLPHVVMDAKEPFQEFEVEVPQPDGTHKAVLVDSLRKMRQIEHETEGRAKNGEGQPMIWRDYSQDQSNFDKHTLGEIDPPLSKAARRRFGRAIKSVDAPSVEYGPGVSDANTSVLPEAP